MRSRVIGIVAAGAVLAISIFLKGNTQYDTHIDAYYVVNLIIISATVMAALALSMIVSYVSKKKAAAPGTDTSALPNRRDHYRIFYEPSAAIWRRGNDRGSGEMDSAPSRCMGW